MKYETQMIGFIPPCVDRFKVEEVDGELVIHIPEALLPLFHSINDIAEKFPEFSDEAMTIKQIQAYVQGVLEVARNRYNTQLFLDSTRHSAEKTDEILASSRFKKILARYRASLAQTMQQITGSHWKSCID